VARSTALKLCTHLLKLRQLPLLAHLQTLLLPSNLSLLR
jgi:hypothetical protein